MHRCPSLSSHPISRIESCIPISIVLQSPFLYYFLPFLLPPPTFLLLVALPRTPCITIISLQLSASSAGELHFCKDAPYTRWVNEPDVRLLFLFLFLLHMLDFVFLSFFFFFWICPSLYITTKTWRKNGWMLNWRKRANHYEYRKRSRWLYLSVLCILLHLLHAVRTCWKN